jgi:hypothetical protein
MGGSGLMESQKQAKKGLGVGYEVFYEIKKGLEINLTL